MPAFSCKSLSIILKPPLTEDVENFNAMAEVIPDEFKNAFELLLKTTAESLLKIAKEKGSDTKDIIKILKRLRVQKQNRCKSKERTRKKSTRENRDSKKPKHKNVKDASGSTGQSRNMDGRLIKPNSKATSVKRL